MKKTMLTQKKIKLIKSLDSKKKRDESGLFIIEGDKMVSELIHVHSNDKKWRPSEIYATEEWIKGLPEDTIRNNKEILYPVTDGELKKISNFKTPNQALALLKKPIVPINEKLPLETLCLGFEQLQDPGNMGTIIRTANWFGINHIFCSTDSVDIYNPKTIQSSMSGFFSTNIYYVNLFSMLDILNKNSCPILGTTLEGEPIRNQSINNKGIILFGNESKGLSKKIIDYCTGNFYIEGSPVRSAESLNVASATAIVCHQAHQATQSASTK